MPVSNVAPMSNLQKPKTNSDFRDFCAKFLQKVKFESIESAITISDLPSPLEGLNLAKIFTDQSSFLENFDGSGCQYLGDKKTLVIYNFLLQLDGDSKALELELINLLSLKSVKDIILEIVCNTEFFQQFKADCRDQTEEEVKNEFFKSIMNQFDISNSDEGLILTLKEHSEVQSIFTQTEINSESKDTQTEMEPKINPTSMCAKMKHSLFFILKIMAYWSLFSKLFLSDKNPDLLFGGNSYQTQRCNDGFRLLDRLSLISNNAGSMLFYLCDLKPACPEGMKPDQLVHFGDYPFGPVNCVKDLTNKQRDSSGGTNNEKCPSGYEEAFDSFHMGSTRFLTCVKK